MLDEGFLSQLMSAHAFLETYHVFYILEFVMKTSIRAMPAFFSIIFLVWQSQDNLHAYDISQCWYPSASLIVAVFFSEFCVCQVWQ